MRGGSSRARRLSSTVLAVGASLCLQACITTTHYQTNSERSATEQLLITTATDRAVMQLAWPRLAGKVVSVQVASITEKDAPYLKAAVEAWLGELGARIVPSGAEAETVSVLAGALGTQETNIRVGIPSFPTPFGVTPPLNVVAFDRQRGYAKLRAVVRDASGATLGASPPVLAWAHRSTFWLFFITFHRGDIFERGKEP